MLLWWRPVTRRIFLLVLVALSFLAGLYAGPRAAGPADVVTVASTEGCAPAHYPHFPDCRVLVQEWNADGEVSLSFHVSPDDPVSRIFE